jgi:tripartite-type tricarboxylate transporter receptor subunit TctC
MKDWPRFLAGLALAVAAAAACAQAYPNRPVRIIVPNAPAGLADVTARLLAAKLAEGLAQQVIVENRVGAGSTIGTAAAVKAAPDGYTLLVVFDSHARNPHLFRNLEYDTVSDLAPVSLLVRGPLVLVVHPGVPAKTVKALVQLARAKPGAINFATVGPGSPARLLMELLKLEARIEVTNVPYKGAGGALTDLVGGHVDAMFPTVSSAAGHVKSDRLRAIAVTSEQRSPVFPGVPTMRETYPGFVAESWAGLLAPARTPPEIIARLNAEVAKALVQPDLRLRLADLGLEAVGGPPGDFDKLIRAEIERWGKVIRAQKITLE